MPDPTPSCPADRKSKLAAGCFLWLIARLRRQSRSGWIVLRGGSRMFIAVTREAVLKAARLEKQGLLSRQEFTRDLVFPILGEGVFSSDEASWRNHKQAILRYLRPTQANVLAWRRAARQATLNALAGLGDDGVSVPAVAFCRSIMQEVLLRTLFGTAELDRQAVCHASRHAGSRCFTPFAMTLLRLAMTSLRAQRGKTLYRLCHHIDAMAEIATFLFLVFGRSMGRVLARPFQWSGRLARRRLEKIIQTAVQAGSPASDPAFYRNAPSLLFAGQDTSTTAFAFVLWSLACDLPAQSRIRQEVLTLGSESPGLRETILDTLRRFPPVHTLPCRTALEDLDIDGTCIPAGSEVIYCLWMAHRDQQRHCERSAASGRRDFPFGVGPKHCPGEHLSLVALSEAVACVLEHTTVLEDNGEPLILGARTVLVPKKLRLHLRPVCRSTG